MAARILDGLFLGPKRWLLEDALVAAGHTWTRTANMPGTWSGVDCVCLILCWIDRRGDPSGRLYDVTPRQIETAALWTGNEGVLYRALVSTGWIDETAEGPRWHDYYALNGNSIKSRKHMRSMRERERDRGNERGNGKGNERGGNRGNETGTSGSDSEKTQTQRGVQRGDRRGAPSAPLGGASVAPPEPDPEAALKAAALRAYEAGKNLPQVKPMTPERRMDYLRFVKNRIASCVKAGIPHDPLPRGVTQADLDAVPE